jgi:hypothetical protein
MRKRPIMNVILARRRGVEESDYEHVSQEFIDEDVDPDEKTAQFVCHFEESETARRRHAFHAQLGRAHEFRFTKAWTLSVDPSIVAIQCPHCNLAWHTEFERFVN